MADITATLQNLQLLRLRVVDNGDGTVSLKTTGGAGASGVVSGALTSRSGTVTAGGTAQQLAAANATRTYFLFQNQSAGPLYLRFTGTAAADSTSLKVDAGGAYESGAGFCSNQAVSVFGATTGQAFFAAEG